MKGGFQKKIGGFYEVLSKHGYDCGACMLRYFGAPENLIEEMTSKSSNEGSLSIGDIATVVENSINSSEKAKEYYGGEITCYIVNYPSDENGNFYGWTSQPECFDTLEQLYSDIKNGFVCMALLNRPLPTADHLKPNEWNEVDYGHFVVIGKEDDGTPLLLDTQTPLRDWGNAPVSYKTFSEIYGYLEQEGVHGITIIECSSSPDDIHTLEYYEDEGNLGSRPIDPLEGGGYVYNSVKEGNARINKTRRDKFGGKSKRRKSKTRKKSIRRKSKTRKRSISRKSKTRKRSIRRKSKTRKRSIRRKSKRNS
jgi:hypothetical protein